MLAVVDNYEEANNLVVKYKVQVLRTIIKNGKINELDFSRVEESNERAEPPKASIKSLVTDLCPWSSKDLPEVRAQGKIFKKPE